MKNTKKLKSKFGFTLAEVLITLVIIGIIAAATIPTLLQKHFEQEMISKLKKNYNVLNNAVALAIRENGRIDEWDIGTNTSMDGARKLYTYIKPYLKIQKECDQNTGCFAENYKALFDDESTRATVNSDNMRYKFILEDGTSVAIASKGTNCANSSQYHEKYCGTITLDLNNKQGPNRWGRDIFMLIFTEKNVLPYAIGYSESAQNTWKQECAYIDDSTKPDRNGRGCAAHVISKGNMDYLHRSILND